MTKYIFLLFAALSLSLNAGEELIRNGSLKELDRNKIPVGWEKSVQMDNSRAEVKGDRDGVKIVFLQKDNLLQARIIQFLDIPAGRVYELVYEYRSAEDPELKADVMLTGSGPIFRHSWQAPRGEWTRRRVLFYRPETEKEKLGIYVQNRSLVPIQYRNISLKESRISKEELALHQPDFLVQTVSPADQLVMGDDTKPELEYIVTPSDFSSKYYFEGALFDADKRLRQTVKTLDGGRIKISADKLTDGKNQLLVSFFEKGSDILVDFKKVEIEKVPASELARDIDWSKHGVMRTRDGKAFFPIAMFGLNIKNYWDIKKLKEQGFNAVHSYSFEGAKTGEITPEMDKFLNFADENGMKVILGLPRALAEKPGREKELTEWIRKIRKYPAVLCYYSDEMYCIRHIPERQFAAVRKIIDNEDPHRQWLPFEPPVAGLGKYWDGIMWGGSENMIKLAKLRVGEGKPLISVFGQPDYRAEKSPTPQQLNYNLFMPVINGARGIFYWWYPTLQWHNGEKELLRKYLYAGTQILAESAAALANPQPLPEWARNFSAGNGLKMLKASDGEAVWLFIGNPESGKPVEIILPEDIRLEAKLGPAQRNGKIRLAPGDISIQKSTL